MKNRQDFREKRIMVAGMARSGAAAARLLSEAGARLILYDSKPLAGLPEQTRGMIADLPYDDFLGGDPSRAARDADLIVVSPGLPPELPFLTDAEERGVPVLAEIEIGYLFSDADFIAITGTNGKTTTTALTGEIFRREKPTYVLGNIGEPICARALETKKGDVVVAETAALQLDAARSYHPKGSAVLNITPDHLDRYGTMEKYAEAKARVFMNQDANDFCVLNRDDPAARAMARKTKARVVWFSLEPRAEDGVYARDGQIVWRRGGQETSVMPVNDVRIPGRHNLQNALCAAALALEYGISPEAVAEGIRAFPGVEHRIESVREKDGVLYINDSKGTNPDATIKALEAMTRPVRLILGGFDKHGEFDGLMERLDGVKEIVALGETRDRIAQAARKAGFEAVETVDNLEEAVARLSSRAEAGDCVLLSPACASWDMYPDFEARGAHFKRLVNAL